MHLPLFERRQEESTTSTTASSSTSTDASSTTSSTSSTSSASTTTSATSSTASATSTYSSYPSSTPPPASDNGHSSAYIAIGIVVAFLAFTLIGFFILRIIRKRHSNPKYIPSSYLKNVWTRWKPSARKSLRDSSGLEQLSSRPPVSYASTGAADSAANRAANAAIDRNTSIRSVMTLPAYNPKARDSEQVLGREGERGGMDTVLEFPTEAEEEARRDEEMEALYQVRLARRTEAAEREERRRLRREARERGDRAALRELRDSGTEQSAVEAARAAHDAVRSRERNVSSVSYADLGVARLDGTRIRANSDGSERPLLGDAASMASGRRPSNFTISHDRNMSRTSIVSLDTMGSNEFASPSFPRSRANSGASMMRSETRNGSMSSPEMIEHGSEDVPDQEPPEYVDVSLEMDDSMGAPPEYFSPVDGRPPSGFGRSPTLRQTAHTNAQEAAHGIVSEAPLTTAEDVLGTPSAEHGSVSTTTRGVGGVPQLPSLRLSQIPSIAISESSPVVRERSEER